MSVNRDPLHQSGVLKESFLAQMTHFLMELEKNKSLVTSSYKKGVKAVKKLAKCSRRRAHKVFPLVYACRVTCKAFLEKNPSLDPQELLDVACEVLEEELDRLKLSPEQIDSMRSALEELLGRDLQELEWDDLPP